jgi:hypothetical protein
MPAPSIPWKLHPDRDDTEDPRQPRELRPVSLSNSEVKDYDGVQRFPAGGGYRILRMPRLLDSEE